MTVFFLVSEDVLENYTLDAFQKLVFVNVSGKDSKSPLDCLRS
jgi:hypothetical protein